MRELDLMKIELENGEVEEDINSALEKHSFSEVKDASDFIDRLISDFKKE